MAVAFLMTGSAQMEKGGKRMDDVGALWLAICILTIFAITTVAVLFIVTWQKIDLIYDIVRKKKLDGDNHA